MKHVANDRHNVIVLANVVELGQRVAMKIAGGKTATTKQILTDAVTARVNSHINVHLGGVK